jgi:hypothetical protein
MSESIPEARTQCGRNEIFVKFNARNGRLAKVVARRADDC